MHTEITESGSMEKPDTITVFASRREEIRANRAEIHLSVKGSSFVTGDAAIKKAKEICQLVGELTVIGVKSDEIALRGVQAESSTGILGRSTSANYLLRIQCMDLERLADILGVITSQKNVTLDQLVWRFPDDATVRAKWLDACLAEAKEKAQQIAVTLGIKLLGVHALTEKYVEADDQKRVLFADGVRGFAARSRQQSLDLGFALVTSKEVGVEVEVHFRVSGYE